MYTFLRVPQKLVTFVYQWRCFHASDICCCSSCLQFRAPSDSKLPRTPRFRQVGTMRLLSSAEDKERNFVAACEAVVGVCHPESLPSSCHWGREISYRHTPDGSSQQIWELFFEERVSAGGSLVHRRVWKLSSLHRNSTMQHRAWIELFLPSCFGWRRRPRAESVVWSATGLDFGEVCLRGSEVEACRAEYQSFMLEQRQQERSSRRSRPDVGNVLAFWPLVPVLASICLMYVLWPMM